MNLSRRLVLASGAACATLALAATPSPAVVGGNDASPGEYPSVAEVTLGPGFLCTGTLIAPTWVLTAAHCIASTDWGISQDMVTADTVVYAGTLTSPDSMHAVAAAATFFDTSYQPTVYGLHDMGLVELAAPLAGVEPARVNLDPTRIAIDQPLTIVGFGDDHAGTEYVLDTTGISCAAAGFDDAKIDCIGESMTSGIGGGDSGGPWFADVRGRPVLVGVTSFMTTLGGGAGAAARTDGEAAFLVAHVPALACTSDADCSPTETCAKSTCIGRACTQDSDCAADQACFDGGCIVAPGMPGGLGAACGAGTDCDSGVCSANIAGPGACVIECSTADPGSCPDGYQCQLEDRQCLPAPPAPSDGGCDASGAGGATGVLGLALIAVAIRSRSRSRSRSR